MYMGIHEDILFSLLRKSLWGTPAAVPHDFQAWRDVVRLARSQSVMGLVGNVMISDPDIYARLSEKAIDKLKSFVMTNMTVSHNQERVIQKSVTVLKNAGISPVMMKGRSLAHYYPDPSLRQCGDIDLYVGKAAYREAYAALKPLSREIDDIRKLDIGIHFDADIDGTDVEVHRYSERYPTRRLDQAYQAASDKGLSENLVTIKILDTEVDTPSDTFNAFYIFSHMFRHFLFEGVGLRQLCDWTMFLHARGRYIDAGSLREMIESMDMMKPWQAFGCVLVDVLGLSSDEFPLYDAKYKGSVGKIVDRILSEGNFGKKRDVFTKRGNVYLLNKTRSFFGHIRRTFEMFSIFPKHAFRQVWHTFADALGRVWTDFRIKFGIYKDAGE